MDSEKSCHGLWLKIENLPQIPVPLANRVNYDGKKRAFFLHDFACLLELVYHYSIISFTLVFFMV